MKKRILLIFVILAVATLTFLAGCTKSLMDNQRLSELRSDIFIGEDDNYSVVVLTGMREDPFNIDGESTKEKTYFTVITITPAAFNPAAEYGFSMTVAGETFSGELGRHPFNQTYSTELAMLTAEVLELTIIKGEAQSVIPLASVKTENYIDGDKAFSIAEKQLKSKVEEMGEEYEIFVRLIDNPINPGGGYYWYVAYIFAGDKTLGVLIDPVTMEIMSVRD